MDKNSRDLTLSLLSEESHGLTQRNHGGGKTQTNKRHDPKQQLLVLPALRTPSLKK